jgi:hypothetical protein
VLSKNFIVSSISQEEPTEFVLRLDFNFHLLRIPWTLELEYALEKFSLPSYLDWLDQHYLNDLDFVVTHVAENFLIYLKHKVSNLCDQNQALAAPSHVAIG